MELSSSKKFFIFPEIEPCTFQPKLQKIKKIHPEKICFTSRNGNCEKKFHVFSKENFSYIQETETLKNFLYFRK